ncbi:MULTISPECIES: tyrosine-type recombinase/integrase [Calothrix]|uniref:Site-specific integrase n=2 Tax=Calothrix TaxID=1186 RepID=A0ABR8ADE8_9CYAN|nr:MULTISPECIES: site-specific integrase [Calothrix]MBD2197939.1 site-specific integrase [Calothrix parietina FACHB-288]MBD2226776.1 site-specific integrase [Calothrix anomala FACHB-343]
MKVNGHGQASVFSKKDYEKILLLTPGKNHRMIFRLCYWTAARMGEVCKLKTSDVYFRTGKPFDKITYEKGSTKTKKTRQIPVSETLKQHLQAYWQEIQPDYDDFLFPGLIEGTHLQFQSADDALRRAIKKAGLDDMGYSTHSFRRSTATQLSRSGIALPVIKQITGHSSLQSLQLYIDTTEDQVLGAIATL